MRVLLQKVLATLARAAIKKYHPIIVGITGSVGKTSTRGAVFTVLKTKFNVRTAEKNYNNEIGLPLAILGIPYSGRNVFGWLSAFARVIFKLSGFTRDEYPEILVLEYGIDKPGDMDYLLSIAKPHISIVTAIGEIPAHVEFFEGPEGVAREKRKLVEALPIDGWAILNHDDPTVYDMKSYTQAHAMTFGTEKHAGIKIFNYQFSIFKDEKLGDIPAGVTFKIEHEGDVVPFRLPGAFGLSQAYAAAAAVGAGLIISKYFSADKTGPSFAGRGINLVEMSEALRAHAPPPGRLRLLEGVKNSFILDDTYNASPGSMRLALETLKELPGKRKIAVLGDMLEIGKYAEQAHRAVGDKAATFVDILFCVGPRAKFIADEFKMVSGRGVRGAPAAQGPAARVFDDSVAAGKTLDPLIKDGDLVLVKGSQSMRMEKAVLEIMAHPERAKELLVRQEKYWQ